MVRRRLGAIRVAGGRLRILQREHDTGKLLAQLSEGTSDLVAYLQEATLLRGRQTVQWFDIERRLDGVLLNLRSLLR